MLRINILCEGTTELDFVEKVLYPHFIVRSILLTPHNLGGGFQYERLKHLIIEWLNYDKEAYVTTMIDLYGMNKRYPGYLANRLRPSLEKVSAVENAMKVDILKKKNLHNTKFIPYIQLHEFEALLFSDPVKLEEWLSLDNAIPVNSFSTIRRAFDTPEDINDSPHTAPSKRIENIVSSYNKITEGVTIASDIGLEKIRRECKHFDAWITKLEDLAAPPTPSIV